MADSSLFNIDSTLPNVNELLQRRPTAHTASTLVRKPGNRQSNPIEILDIPPPLRQAVPAAWHEVPQAPSTPSWFRQPWRTVHDRRAVVESSAQASAQESFSPLPPPITLPPSRRKYHAASTASVHDTNNPLPLWLQSPSPEVKI